jgi:hypothetical protein
MTKTRINQAVVSFLPPTNQYGMKYKGITRHMCVPQKTSLLP